MDRPPRSRHDFTVLLLLSCATTVVLWDRPGCAQGTGQVHFRRGDCNTDGGADVSDAVFLLSSLFLGGRESSCLDACDADSDLAIEITDAIFLLGYLFLGDGEPGLPGPFRCALAPAGRALSCQSYDHCGSLTSVFDPPALISLEGREPFGVVSPAVDLDGDGFLDTAVTFRENGGVVVLLGDGTGAFAAAQSLALTLVEDYSEEAIAAGAGASGSGMGAADLDEDGDLDLIAADSGQPPLRGGAAIDVPGYLVVFRNDAGRFSRAGVFTTGKRTIDVLILDANRDQKPDLIAVNRWENGSYQVFLNEGSLEFSPQPEVFFVECPNPHFSDAIGDFNGDAIIDFVLPCAEPQRGDPPTGPAPSQLRLLSGNGDGGFRDAVVFSGFGLQSSHHVVAGDFDLDHRLDVATSNIGASPSDGRITVLLGDGTGGFTAYPGSPYPVAAPGTTTAFIATADLGGSADARPDGRQDLVVVNRAGAAGTENSISVLMNVLLDPSPSTSFLEGLDLRLPLPVGERVNLQAPFTGDFNHDGFVDLGLAQFGSAQSPAGILILLHTAYQ